MKSYSVTIQMKATEQYFPVVLFIMPYQVVLTFESADEILWCDHSNESSPSVLTHDAICLSKFHKMKFRNLVEIFFWLIYIIYFNIFLLSCRFLATILNFVQWNSIEAIRVSFRLLSPYTPHKKVTLLSTSPPPPREFCNLLMEDCKILYKC